MTNQEVIDMLKQVYDDLFDVCDAADKDALLAQINKEIAQLEKEDEQDEDH